VNLYRWLMFKVARTRVGRWYQLSPFRPGHPPIDKALYRLTGGRVMTGWVVVDMLLITTSGRKTGRPFTTPVVFVCHGEDILLVATNGGKPGQPQWFRNVRANADARLGIRGSERDYRARIASADEHRELWPVLVKRNPSYLTYRERKGQDLPIVVLSVLDAD